MAVEMGRSVSEEDEFFLVRFPDFAGLPPLSSERFETLPRDLEFADLDSPAPSARIGGMLFRGVWELVMGTEVLFEDKIEVQTKPNPYANVPALFPRLVPESKVLRTEREVLNLVSDIPLSSGTGKRTPVVQRRLVLRQVVPLPSPPEKTPAEMLRSQLPAVPSAVRRDLSDLIHRAREDSSRRKEV